MLTRRLLAVVLACAVVGLPAAPAAADPPTHPGGPCLQDNQNVSRSSVAGYADVVNGLDRIARTSKGLVTVHKAGRSGEGRDLLYATVGRGPDVFWLHARIHGDELHSTESVLQVLDHLASGDPDARLIRERMTVIVIPMYNPDGAEANIRQSTTPNRIDLNRDWENFAQPESRAWYALWQQMRPRLALDLHHMGTAPVVEGTDELNQFQIGIRPIDPSRMTATQWRTAQQLSMVSVNALDGFGQTHVARYPDIDITNAVLSRMLLGGPGPDGSSPGFATQGAIFYEVRSVGQKSNGYLERLFTVPTMAVLNAVARGELAGTDVSGIDAIPRATQGTCGV
ncbi:hypothetical protein E1286_11925 [Nonomuraea terrae]|uniref:Peptidase M14 domain-containing protein n=1 Tax=Nonomuraea terrae TaxID=2530383 RepID=A0A4R4Z125_9ACTN|nr:M14 family zinc carboxypeptidase [Nonomuraea terrae]TDD50644.1 hypothetical protein E1286_11925 [Nonomuraea terrae]